MPECQYCKKLIKKKFGKHLLQCKNKYISPKQRKAEQAEILFQNNPNRIRKPIKESEESIEPYFVQGGLPSLGKRRP